MTELFHGSRALLEMKGAGVGEAVNVWVGETGFWLWPQRASVSAHDLYEDLAGGDGDMWLHFPLTVEAELCTKNKQEN